MEQTAGYGAGVRVPDALLDGGGEAWLILQEAIERCLDQLMPGHVLEVISQAGEACAALPEWCLASCHELVELVTDGDGARFWIRKGEPERESPATPIGCNRAEGEDLRRRCSPGEG